MQALNLMQVKMVDVVEDMDTMAAVFVSFGFLGF